MDSVCFSVVVPLFNKEYSIERCIDSVLLQTYQSFEIIIVNDGSTDYSLNIVLNKYKKEIKNGIIKVIDQNNQGVSVARNKGIKAAENEEVCLLDADDEWHPSFLEKMSELLNDFPSASLYSFAHFVKKENFEPKKARYGLPEGYRGYVDDFFLRSSKGFIVKSSNVCIRKNSIASIGGFPEGVAAGEDLIVWILLALQGSVVCEVNYLVTVHQQQDASRGARKNIVPYPLVYFSKNKLPKNNSSLKTYIKIIYLHHLKRSFLEKNFKQALSQTFFFLKFYFN